MATVGMLVARSCELQQVHGSVVVHIVAQLAR